jgi:hypothetical protein
MTQEALRMALEAMESVTVKCNNFHHPKKDQNHHWAKCPPVARWDKAITAIKEALAQTQEPVAFWNFNSGFSHCMIDQLNEAAKKNPAPLYTTPPQRKPLTDEQTIILKNTTCPEIDWKARYFVEMNNGERNKWMLEWFIAFKVAIEAAHGITGEKK